MNDTVYAVVQLNGSDNIANTWSNSIDLGLSSPLSIREPYYKREGSYLYMYVGTGVSGKAVELRTKNADNASCAATVSCRTPETTLIINDKDGKAALVAENNTQSVSVSIDNSTIKGVGNPTITGFNIQLNNTNISGTGGYINSVPIINVPYLTLERGSSSAKDNRGYGTHLPSSAELGEIFFLITE